MRNFWTVLIVIVILVSGGLIFFYMSIQGVAGLKTCEKHSDCKSVSGPDAGCWNYKYDDSWCDYDCRLQKTGPLGCACYKNICVDAAMVLSNKASTNFEDAFSFCEEVYTDIEKLFRYCFDILCSSYIYEFERNITSNRSVKDICIEKVSDFCERGKEKFGEEDVDLHCGHFLERTICWAYEDPIDCITRDTRSIQSILE